MIAGIVLAISLHAAGDGGQQTRQHEQLTIRNERRVPGVELSTYTLITRNPEADRQEAEAILEVKVSWPRAMRTKEAALFDEILARAFTFREADGRLLERDAYIRDRVHRAEAVAAVRYENVVLQFFGQLAVLSYRNVVSGTDAGGKPETWHMSWVDVFVREDGRWKIGASHLVSETVEKGVERDVADGGGQVEPRLNAVGWTDRVSEVLLHALSLEAVSKPRTAGFPGERALFRRHEPLQFLDLQQRVGASNSGTPKT